MSATVVLVAGVIALFCGLTGVLVAAFSGPSTSSARGRIDRRLSVYSLSGGQARRSADEDAPPRSVARTARELASRVAASRDLEAKVARRLEAAGLPMRPAEWLLIRAGLVLGSALLCALFGRGLVATLVVGVLMALAPVAFLRWRSSQRTAAFLAQMPDTLQLIAGSLSAGYSLPQAIDAVTRQNLEPICSELNRAIVDSRLGVPLEDALDAVAERMRSKDFAWVVMAVRIQRDVGGNLAEVLATVAETMRERQRLRRQVEVLSAEGRLSALVLGALPVIFFLYLLLVRPDYVRPLYTDVLGIAALVVTGVVFGLGVLWMRVVIRVEV